MEKKMEKIWKIFPTFSQTSSISFPLFLQFSSIILGQKIKDFLHYSPLLPYLFLPYFFHTFLPFSFHTSSILFFHISSTEFPSKLLPYLWLPYFFHTFFHTSSIYLDIIN